MYVLVLRMDGAMFVVIRRRDLDGGGIQCVCFRREGREEKKN